MEKKKPILTVYCGLPGSGKTTLAALFARHCLKKNISVWSNCPITGAIKLDSVDDLGKYYIADGMVLIDEAALEFGNRDWKNFSKQSQTFFRYYRHYNNEVKVFSQDWDGVDKVIRNVAWRYVLISKTWLPWFIKTRTMKKEALAIDENTQQPITKYYWVPLSTRYWFTPPAWKMFNTLSQPETEKKDNWENW